MKFLKKLRRLADPLHLTKRLAPLLKKGVQLGIKTAPLWSSFVPGGSIAANVVARGGRFSKLAGLMSRHPKIVGLVQNVRRMRETGRTKPSGHTPSGYARVSGMHPANPFMNGRYNQTHMRKLARWNVPYQRGYRAQRNRASAYHESEKAFTVRNRRLRRAM